jgi:hypothetical protein
MSQKDLTKCSFGILFTLIMFGCSYPVATKIAPAVNIYSSYEEKIPGKVVLVINDNVKNIHIDVKPSSHICSAHTFPIDLKDTLATSIRQTMESIFSDVIEQQNLPSKKEMELQKINGTIFVSLKRFEPSIRFSAGFWQGYAAATCETVLDVTVADSNNKKIMTTSVGASRTVEGSGGCSKGSEVLSDAISKDTQETMEKLAERVSNNRHIRESFGKN